MIRLLRTFCWCGGRWSTLRCLVRYSRCSFSSNVFKLRINIWKRASGMHALAQQLTRGVGEHLVELVLRMRKSSVVHQSEIWLLTSLALPGENPHGLDGRLSKGKWQDKSNSKRCCLNDHNLQTLLELNNRTSGLMTESKTDPLTFRGGIELYEGHVCQTQSAQHSLFFASINIA